MKSLRSITKRFGLIAVAMLLVVGSLFISPASASADTYEVKMGSDKGMLKFEPKQLTVKPGDTIEWIVNKVPPHNVVFDKTPLTGEDAKASKALATSLSHKNTEMTPGTKFSVTIPTDAPAGDYSYYCTPHRGAGMVGKITVAG